MSSNPVGECTTCGGDARLTCDCTYGPTLPLYVSNERELVLMNVALNVLLQRCVPHLIEFDGKVGNGWSCISCGACGIGSSAEHKPDCAGVKLLREIKAVLGPKVGGG